MAPRKRRQTNKKTSSSNVSTGRKTLVKMNQQKTKSWIYGACVWGAAVLFVLSLVVLALWIPQDSFLEGDPAADMTTKDGEEKKDTGPLIASPGTYDLLETLPHDKNAFTQGLTYANGKLYEGTGLYGKSELRHVDPETGDVLRSFPLEPKLFGEGITYYTDDDGNAFIIQITWKSQRGFIYNATSFELVREFNYSTTTTEGWGITYNEADREFVVSDGSHWIHFWDRDTLKQKRKVPVLLVTEKVINETATELKQDRMKKLNELEMDSEGFILSNVWYKDVLLRIDPTTGYVERNYDFSNLYPYKERIRTADCFNGISVTENEDEFFVTGKQWPNMYRIKLIV